MVTDECMHEMLIGTCSICKEPKAKPKPTPGFPVLARYDGYCNECEQPIYAGVSEIINDGTGWIHVGCF